MPEGARNVAKVAREWRFTKARKLFPYLEYVLQDSIFAHFRASDQNAQCASLASTTKCIWLANYDHEIRMIDVSASKKVSPALKVSLTSPVSSAVHSAKPLAMSLPMHASTNALARSASATGEFGPGVALTTRRVNLLALVSNSTNGGVAGSCSQVRAQHTPIFCFRIGRNSTARAHGGMSD